MEQVMFGLVVGVGGSDYSAIIQMHLLASNHFQSIPQTYTEVDLLCKMKLSVVQTTQ